MKFFAINGSHRKDGNTAQLLEKALEGIKSVCSDAEIESVNLYDVPLHIFYIHLTYMGHSYYQ